MKMTHPESQAEREAFEAAMNAARFFPRELNFARTKSPSGRDEYANSHLQSCWIGWQARAAQSPAVEPARPPATRLDVMSLIHSQMHRVYASAIDREEVDAAHMTEIEDAIMGIYHGRYIAGYDLRKSEEVEPAKAEGWISCAERMPDNPRDCLAVYVTPYGKQRRIRAFYAKQFEIEANGDECDSDTREEDDTEWLKSGWYECIDNWGDYSSVTVTEGVVTHWQPMPAMPAAPSTQPGEQHA
jgi:hypothetical protein